MDAKEAYKLVKDWSNGAYITDVCREYRNTFVFPHGGLHMICVDKKTGNIEEAEIYDLPREMWHSVRL
jgi:hypothetical protein